MGRDLSRHRQPPAPSTGAKQSCHRTSRFSTRTISCGSSNASCAHRPRRTALGTAPGAVVCRAQKDEGRRARVVGDDLFLITHRRVYEAYEALSQRRARRLRRIVLRSHDCGSSLRICCSITSGAFTCWWMSFRIPIRSNTRAACWPAIVAESLRLVTMINRFYGWRGARIENIHRFRQDFGDVQVIRLEQTTGRRERF